MRGDVKIDMVWKGWMCTGIAPILADYINHQRHSIMTKEPLTPEAVKGDGNMDFSW